MREVDEQSALHQPRDELSAAIGEAAFVSEAGRQSVVDAVRLVEVQRCHRVDEAHRARPEAPDRVSADSELRDTEQVPLKEPGGIDAFFEREVLPHAPDAWIATDKTQIGYEISFARYFYKPAPLRTLAENTDGRAIVNRNDLGKADALTLNYLLRTVGILPFQFVKA